MTFGDVIGGAAEYGYGAAMRKLTVAMITMMIASFAAPGAAFGYCSPPDPPDPPYDSVSMPYCLHGYEYSREHTCEDWEINQYVNDVDQYINNLGHYLREADTFYEEAYDYARCESDDAKKLFED